MKSVRLFSLCLGSFIFAATGSAREIVCSFPKKLLTQTHQMTAIKIRSTGPYAYETETVKKQGRKLAKLKSIASHSERFGVEEFYLYDEKELSSDQSQTVTESLSLEKSSADLSWKLVVNRRVHLGEPGCLENEDKDCSSTQERIKELHVECKDSQDSVPPSVPYDYSKDDPCSSSYYQN